MTKISFDPGQQQIQVTRSVGKTGEGQVTISREGGAEININLGIASAGVTTDYGGAVSLGLLGQEITWGREGGTIHIGIGGFEVFVEARDCIVTEIKTIFGNIVAQRSYPDPGCKLPDPPIPPSLPIPPQNPRIENEVELPDTDILGWVPFTEITRQYTRNRSGNAIIANVFVLDRVAKNIGKPTNDSRRIPFAVTITSNTSALPSLDVAKGSYLSLGLMRVYGDIGEPDIEYPVLTYYVNYYNNRVFFGAASIVKKFISDYNTQMQRIYQSWLSTNPPYSTNITELIPTGFIPFKETRPAPFLPTGNKPPMQNCCEEVLDYLADFEEAFEIRRLLKNKFPISNTFMAPECDPESVTEAVSYYEIFQCAFRMMAHGMIFEPRVTIKDADAAKAGDQEFKSRYLNATGWASAVSEALMEVKDDGNVSTNMDIRNGFAVTQMMVGLADALYKLDTVLDCFGIKLQHEEQTVETPYTNLI